MWWKKNLGNDKGGVNDLVNSQQVMVKFVTCEFLYKNVMKE